MGTQGVNMKSSSLLPFLLAILLAATSLFAEQAQDGAQPQKQDSTVKQAAQLKLIKAPTAPYPDEALKKKIEGKVTLSIVVDSEGTVLDAKALSGPPELFQAALDSVKQWQFEPPAHPPVETKVEIGFGYEKECPGPVSEGGEVISGGWLRSKKGTVIGEDFDIDQPLPPYFLEDRKAGIAGVMVLSITVTPDGRVKKVHVVKSLSPHLDEAAMKTVRQWRFKLIKGIPDALPDDFELPIIFKAMCRPQF
jgi:TonB family protein